MGIEGNDEGAVPALARRIDQALGRCPADLLLRGGQVLDLARGEFFPADVAIAGDRIVGVGQGFQGTLELDVTGRHLVPGFVDTHVHVESSMVTPAEFQACVVPRGTTTAVCDPHEISNVLGSVGLEYFLESSLGLAMDLRVNLSSCVPATGLETSGARLDVEDLLAYADHPSVIGLAEFMNFPGVFAGDPGVLAKLAAFQGRHIDGHCPLVTGRQLGAYRAAGVLTDHESSSPEEALEKLRQGFVVLIREGSAARDAGSLAPVLDAGTSPFMALCTDDRNPLDIEEEGHLDHAIRTLIAAGAPVAAVYRAASWSGARAFGFRDRGLVAPGYRADLVLLEDVEACAVAGVVLGGVPVDGPLAAAAVPAVGRGSVHLEPIDVDALAIRGEGARHPVIGANPGSLLTDFLHLDLPSDQGRLASDLDQDALKVCVLARHGSSRNIGRGFVRGFGLRRGAIASSVGHDSHNVIVVGASDAEMVVAVNRLIELQGGVVVAAGGQPVAELALPLAGLMSDRPVGEVTAALRKLRGAARELGCRLEDPFLQLAFLPLPVIPHLKITDMGLVDVDRFQLI